MSVQEQHTVIDKMVDAIIYIVHDPEDLYKIHSSRHVKPMARLHYLANSRFGELFESPAPPEPSQESTERSLDAALIVSAIYRGDHVELQALLDRCDCSGLWDENLGLVPVDLAYKQGTREVIRTLVEHGCVTRYPGKPLSNSGIIKGLAVAARRGNKEVLETWVTLLSERGGCLSSDLHEAMLGALKIGKFEMAAVLDKNIDWTESDMKLIWFECFHRAVENGMLDVLKWLLSREGSSLAGHARQWHKTPLFIAMKEYPVEKRLAVVGLLLNHGVDPDGGGRKLTYSTS
ncbi:hypothetical protein N7463_001629 [Penicillium fimorum]|uniref:Ankyrin n=1 Tax=Penicillium fimorum TaxID=1882269 RepID=A0A9W9XXP9_9EURO|nr:hypothetical protein N7463_001629 [Penicillium fimorum]